MSKEVTVLKVCGKTSDRCSISFLNKDGVTVGESNGYVPNYFPEEHYGDYIEFDIDVKTGKILNWTPPTQEQIKNSMDNENN